MTKKQSLTIVWRDPVSGTPTQIRIGYTPDYFAGTDHLELQVLKPKDAKLPVTETGYRSQFLKPHEATQAGGLQAYVEAWLNREAEKPAWRKAQGAVQQGDLFSWAEDKGPKRPKAKPSSPPARKPRP